MVKDSGCTYTTGYFVRRPSGRSERWRVVARQIDSAQACWYFIRRLPRRMLREFSIGGLSGYQSGVGLCVTFAAGYGVIAEPARRLPTTAPLDATGPEDPEGGVYGLIHPRRFTLAVVPFSFGFRTSDAHWRGWGTPAATGTGNAEFNVIMSSSERVSYRLILSHRRLIKCRAGRDHYSYEKVAILMADYRGAREDFAERMHVGCSPRPTGLL
jgi:hypothetical protein